MKWLALTVLFFLLACTSALASFETDDPLQQIEDLRAEQDLKNAKIVADRVYLEKKVFLKLLVSSYVNGFKEFDTAVATTDHSVSVSIYYDISLQNQRSADQLADRFRQEIPQMLKPYRWAENVAIEVLVNADDRSR